MGWFGMPGYDKKSAFETLFSHGQYDEKIEMLWKKETASKSIAVFKLGDKTCGQVILGYRKYQRLKKEDILAHEMHIGFSAEEKQRVSNKNYSKIYVKKYPLIDMEWERKDSYKYILEKWGLDTKASACSFCPFHQNYFFNYMKLNYKDDYEKIVEFDNVIGERQPQTKIKSKIFISKARKRISDLTDSDCNDAQYFDYDGKQIRNGF